MRVLVYSAQMESIGGIESHVVEFCLHLSKAGHRITLMSSRFALNANATHLLREAGVELLVNGRRWSSGSPWRKWLWTVLSLLRVAHRPFDVVYTNGQGRNVAVVLGWFKGRARRVHHHHTSCDQADIATWPRAYARAMKRADAVVVCAEFIRGRMQAAIDRADVSVVYCFSPQLIPGATSPTQPDTRVVFGYFGRLIPEKGIDWILRLSEEPRLAHIAWRIWGAESAYRASDFQSYDRVEYRGPFSTPEGHRSAVAELQCFCLFSTHPEGLPLSLLEIMSAGKPWIATSQGGVPELSHDPDACLLVSLDDYAAVVAACLAMSERIIAGRIDAARQIAFYRSRFSAAALLPAWMNLLQGAA